MAKVIDIAAFQRDREDEVMRQAQRLLNGMPQECVAKIVRSLERQSREEATDSTSTDRSEKP